MAGFSSWFESIKKDNQVWKIYEEYCDYTSSIGDDPVDFKRWARSYFEENRDTV